jgi:hypothetical protein
MNGGTDFIIRSMPDYSRREIIFLVQHEKILHLDDFVLGVLCWGCWVVSRDAV